MDRSQALNESVTGTQKNWAVTRIKFWLRNVGRSLVLNKSVTLIYFHFRFHKVEVSHSRAHKQINLKSIRVLVYSHAYFEVHIFMIFTQFPEKCSNSKFCENTLELVSSSLCSQIKIFKKLRLSRTKIPEEPPKYVTSRACLYFAAKVIGWFFSE